MPYNINGFDYDLAAPNLTDGTTFVPAAAVAEALGGTVEWKHDAKTARIELNGKVAFLGLDTPTASIDGAAVDMGANAYLEGDSLWVPVRIFRDGFGASLNVDGDSVSLSV